MVASVYLASFKLFSNQTTAVDVSSQNTIGIDEIANQVKESVGVEDCPDNISGTTLCGPYLFPPPGCGFGCPNPNFGKVGVNILSLKLWPLDSAGKPVDPSTITGATAIDYAIYKIPFFDNSVEYKTHLEKYYATYSSNPGNFKSARAGTCGTIACIIPTPHKILATNVSSVQFQYYDSNNVEITSTPYTNTTQIVITLKTSKNTLPPNATPLELTQTKKAVLRNK